MLLEVKSVEDSNPRGESGQRLKDALTGRVGVLEKRRGCGGG
ncbi:hypothetical protein PF005_g31543 [Phytophthora fragariae]|uniref:Uncharacterized protein n=1 Tax=Phytophthora fragariae TaxID=53985 RepID=A0A6A3V6F7_9STRA|nr:hypothetical protein PF003_g16541 [Phytophthora fragariae]KAE8899489.1 hypothetical protein PF003_g16540 [Phytophthora fragariae]KAE8916882.1 hypothetical protein PF009_g32796 [Phytophthora fragariae]KAE8916883.1 hypothetical protein PF009_g32795 [Phytophthora fragariae]KAE8917895.1 hypothetical protein PF009_g31786 [Phytophthora fragariae]